MFFLWLYYFSHLTLSVAQVDIPWAAQQSPYPLRGPSAGCFATFRTPAADTGAGSIEIMHHGLSAGEQQPGQATGRWAAKD